MNSDENYEHAEEPNDLMKYPAIPRIKMCFVKLEKMDLNRYSDFDSSDEDLPSLPYVKSSLKKNPPKSAKELIAEHENIAKNIQVGNMSNSNIEEKLKTIQILPLYEVEDASLSPASVVNEERNIKVLFVNDTFQFFNIGDVTLEQCGYDSDSEDLTEYEKTMLSFRRVELERVLSSSLFSSSICCISDCKSFVTFLLRNLSVHTDIASVEACYNVLNMILDKHPNAKSLNFCSAEIFMLLFNHGTDIDSFKFLAKRPIIRRYLEEPKDKSKSKMPEKWMFNLKITLNAVMNLIINCEFKPKDLCDIIIYFLWMSLDSLILRENLFSCVRDCICVCLEHVPTDKWPRVMREVTNVFISEEFINSQDEWSYVYHIAESVPVTCKRGHELRRYISYLALIQFEKAELTDGGSEQRAEVNKTLNGFSLKELESLLKSLVGKASDLVMSFTIKFLNLCFSNLEATDKDLKNLCDILKSAEKSLYKSAIEAKTHFAILHARLKLPLDKSTMYKSNSEENEEPCTKVKKEVYHDVDVESFPNAYHFVKVKEEPEPVQEHVPYEIDHRSEKIISFSEFDCENDDEEELDFDMVEKSAVITRDIDMHIVSNAIKTEKKSGSCMSDSNESENFILNMPLPSLPSRCDIDNQDDDNNSEMPIEDSLEIVDNSLKNSIIIDSSSEMKDMTALNVGDNLSSPDENNQNSCINNYGINEELVSSELESYEEPLSLPLSCELGSDFTAEFENNSRQFSHGNEVNNFASANSSCEFQKEEVCEDVLIDAVAVSHVAVTGDNLTVPSEDVFAVESTDVYEDISSEKHAFSDGDVSVNNQSLSVNNSFITHADDPTEKSALPVSEIAFNYCKRNKELKSFSEIHCGDENSYSVLPESSDNCVGPSVSDQLINQSELQFDLPLLNDDLTKDSPSFSRNYGNESSSISLQSDISMTPVTSANSVKRISQSDPVQLLGNSKSDLSCELLNPSTSYHVESIGNNLMSESSTTNDQIDSGVITVEDDFDNSALGSSFSDNSNLAQQNDNLFHPVAENCSPSLTKLVESLVLPEGTEILPVKTKADSTLKGHMPEITQKNTDIHNVSFEKVVIDEEVVCINEINSPGKVMVNQNKNINHVETIESDGSDKELIILFVKPIPRNKISNKSHKDKSKHLENKTKYITHELELSNTQPNSVGSKPSGSNNFSYDIVSNQNTEVSRRDTVLCLNVNSRSTESSSEVMVVESSNDAKISSNVSDNDGVVFIQCVDSPCTKELCTSHSNETVIKNNELIGSKSLTVENSIESIENRTSDDNDLNLVKSNSTMDNPISLVENLASSESDILSECIVRKDAPAVNVEIVSIMNDSILEKLSDLSNCSKSTAVKEQESEMNISSTYTDAPIKDGNKQEKVAMINNCMLEDSSTIKSISSLEDGKLGEIRTDKNLKIKTGQSLKDDSKLCPEGKVKHLKRKSMSDDVSNPLLQSVLTQNGVEPNVTILNNLLESSVISKDNVNRSVYKPTQCTKSLQDNITKFNSSSSLPLSSFKEETISSCSSQQLSEESDLGTLSALQKGTQDKLEIRRENPEYPDSLQTSVKRNSILFNSIEKSPDLNAIEGSNQIGMTSKCKSKRKLLPSMSDSYSSKKRKNIESHSPSSKFQMHFTKRSMSSSHGKFRKSDTSKSPLKLSPKKSFVSTKSIKNKNSPKKYLNYKLKMTNHYTFKDHKNHNILTSTGLNLSNLLREKLQSSSSNHSEQIPSSSKVEVCVSSDSDSDVVELYCDPKRYADQECVILYESEELVLLDSD